MDVGHAIRLIRTQLSLPQGELADRVGISASYLSLIEKGRRMPTLALLEVIADRLGVEPAVLLAISKNPAQQPAHLRRLHKDFTRLFTTLLHTTLHRQ